MKKTKTIKRTNLPARMPWGMTALAYLLMDKFQISGIIQGVIWTLIVLFWLAVIVSIWNEDDIDIFDKPKV
jgi:hypothetical protein